MTSCWAKAREALESASPQARRTRATRASGVPARDMQFFSQRFRRGRSGGNRGRRLWPIRRSGAQGIASALGKGPVHVMDGPGNGGAGEAYGGAASAEANGTPRPFLGPREKLAAHGATSLTPA